MMRLPGRAPADEDIVLKECFEGGNMLGSAGAERLEDIKE